MKLYICNEFTILGDYNGNPFRTFEQNHFIIEENEEKAKEKALQNIRKEKLTWVKEEDIEHMMQYEIAISLIEVPNEIDGYAIKLEKN